MFSQHKIGAFHISGKSPFPDVDGMVETIASVDNVPGMATRTGCVLALRNLCKESFREQKQLGSGVQEAFGAGTGFQNTGLLFTISRATGIVKTSDGSTRAITVHLLMDSYLHAIVPSALLHPPNCECTTVMYIVDFRTAGYYQKCHDPDCRGMSHSSGKSSYLRQCDV